MYKCSACGTVFDESYFHVFEANACPVCRGKVYNNAYYCKTCDKWYSPDERAVHNNLCERCLNLIYSDDLASKMILSDPKLAERMAEELLKDIGAAEETKELAVKVLSKYMTGQQKKADKTRSYIRGKVRNFFFSRPDMMSEEIQKFYNGDINSIEDNRMADKFDPTVALSYVKKSYSEDFIRFFFGYHGEVPELFCEMFYGWVADKIEIRDADTDYKEIRANLRMFCETHKAEYLGFCDAMRYRYSSS